MRSSTPTSNWILTLKWPVTCTKTGMILLIGEISSSSELAVDYDRLVRRVLTQVGYTHCHTGIDADTCAVLVGIGKQDAHLARAVHEGREEVEELGAGDQGLMFGYACDETPEYLPLTILLAHRITAKMAQLRKEGHLPWARPDGKAQVTIEYASQSDGGLVPLRVHTIVVSSQHSENVSNEEIRQDLKEKVIDSVVPSKYLDDRTIYHLNVSGRFTTGGPLGDAGVTGRKIIVDTYGGWAPHGGGAFSGKDPSKVDRSAAYAARWIALSLVNAGLCKRVLVQVSYAVGVSEPLAVSVTSYGTCSPGYDDTKLMEIINNNFDLRPGAIIKELDLLKPIYQQTSTYGHFGHREYSWEKPKQLKL